MQLCDKCRKEIHQKDEKIWYGEFVQMSEKEHAKLVTKYGKIQTLCLIEKLDNFIGTKKKDPYRSHYRAILNWVVEACKVYELRKEEKIKETVAEVVEIPASQEVIDKEIKKMKEILSKAHRTKKIGNVETIGQALTRRLQTAEAENEFNKLQKVNQDLKKHYDKVGRPKRK